MEHPHHHVDRFEDMLSVEVALARILNHFNTLEAEEKPLLEALGQTLAGDIVAPISLPPLANSAMDGYAVIHDDVALCTQETPRVLRVIGEIAAGHLPGRPVTEGTAIRIMTGAPIPEGADMVVPFEATDELQRRASGSRLETIAIFDQSGYGANVRPAGEDVVRGAVLLHEGTLIRPFEIGVLASIGLKDVAVIRRPEVAILSTGDELVEPGGRLVPGKIYDANGFSIAASVLRYGGIPRFLGIAKDNFGETNQKLDEGLSADLLITSAGVSKGDYDLVKDVLMQRGDISFWSVRMRPARPLAFGSLDGPMGRKIPHVGLPGNPVSALVAFEQFCRPALLKMSGRKVFAKPTIQATLQGPIFNTDGRRVYARVRVSKKGDDFLADPTGPQGSNILTSISRANGLAICPEEVPEMKTGQLVNVQMLDWPEEV